MAQRDVASFKATKNSRYAANTSGLITASNSQDMFDDVADSFLNKTDHFIDEDSFASNSATKVPSQQSVKAYVDAQVAVGGLTTATVDITSSEILNIFTTPKQIIAAPGAGKILQVVSLMAYYKFGTTAYSASASFAFKYDNASGAAVNISSLTMLDNAADALIFPELATQTNDVLVTPYVNKNIIFTNTSANPTSGDGTLRIYVTYKTITVP